MFTRYAGLLIAFSLFIVTLGAQAATDESKVPEPFRGHMAGSPIQIKYDDWDLILKQTVMRGGRSDRDKASTVRAKLGSRVVRGNTSDTRNEGNRIAFPAFKDDNLEILTAIRKSLESVPGMAPMKEWTKNEQLAYWLNLYNITLVEQVAKEYPVRKLDKLMKSSRKKPSLWDTKLLKVAGVDLSLNDIHHKILIPKWDSTLIMYGLFQGYVGSPNIMKEAFTGDQVHSQLVRNATEFVNSNRGMQVRGTTLQISTLYKDNKALFPDWDEDLKKHFVSLVDYDYRGKVQAAKKIRAKNSDYYIADVFGGGRLPGSGTNTNSAALNDAMIRVNEGAGSLAGSGASMGFGSFTMEQYSDMKRAKEIRFPSHVVEYLEAQRKRNATKEGEVEVEEIDDDNQ